MAGKVYRGDIGTVIIVNTKEDLTAATVTNIKVKKPNKTEVIWTGEKYETTKIKYIIQENDFDVAGEYFVQAYIEIPGWKGRGETTSFTVYERFA